MTQAIFESGIDASPVGAGIWWWIISGVLAALAGGYGAGRLAGQPKQASGGWHGLTGALATLVIFALLTTTAGAIASGALRFLGTVAGGAAQTLGHDRADRGAWYHAGW